MSKGDSVRFLINIHTHSGTQTHGRITYSGVIYEQLFLLFNSQPFLHWNKSSVIFKPMTIQYFYPSLWLIIHF